MTWLRPLTFSALIICSCSTNSLASKESNALASYSTALQARGTDDAKACEIFQRLSGEKSFVLTDVAYVRALQVCAKDKITPDWNRSVPAWLEKEKQLMYHQSLSTAAEKGLFIQKNPIYFPSPERVKAYQAALADTTIAESDKMAVQESLYAIAPRFMPDPQPKDYLRIVKDVRSVRDFDKAVNLLTKLIKDPKTAFDTKFLAHREMVTTLKVQKDKKKAAYMKAVKAWAEMISEKQFKEHNALAMYTEAQLNRARVVWTEEGVEPAMKHLDKMLITLQNRHTLFEIYWLRARMHEEKKNFNLAIADLEKALLEKIPQWRDQEKILWSLAWSQFKMKNFAEAEKHLRAMIDNKETSPFARFKYLYWKGESQQRREQPEDAKATWEQLTQEDLFGYYGLLAHHQLNKPLKPVPDLQFSGDPAIKGDNEKIFSALVKVEEWDLAGRMVAANTPDANTLKTLSAPEVSAVFYARAQARDYKFVFQAFNQLPYETQREVYQRIPKVLFPQPYDVLMVSATQATGLEPELLYSIMRQESSFDPEARSPMDAMGLLQVLPEVGKQIAKQNQIQLDSYEDLFKENINIQIGSRLLKKQSDSFKGKFPLYVASYNASPYAVRKWRERYEGDDLMFIENIPYEETKTYVKLVLRNYILYKKMKHGDEFKFFPRHLLVLEN